MSSLVSAAALSLRVIAFLAAEKFEAHKPADYYPADVRAKVIRDAFRRRVNALKEGRALPDARGAGEGAALSEYPAACRRRRPAGGQSASLACQEPAIGVERGRTVDRLVERSA